MTALEKSALALCAGFFSGVFCASLIPVSVPAVLCLGVAGFALLALAASRHSMMFVCAAALVFGAVLGVGRFMLSEQQLRTAHDVFEDGVQTEITGIVQADPDSRETTARLHIAVERINDRDISGVQVLAIVDRHARVVYGDRVVVVGTPEIPEVFETETHRIFDYPSFLKKDGVTHHVAFAEIEVREHGAGNPLIATLLSAKHALSSGIQAALVEPYAALSQGLLLGEKRALGDDLFDVFRTTGLIHIVVLSGYNIALIARWFASVISRFRVSKNLQLLAAALSIVAFVIATGASATSVRAGLMALLVITAHMLGRSADMFRLLLAAGVGMVAWNPYVLAFDPGFQLSFLATAGLIAFSPHIERRLQFVTEKFALREIATATIATQIAVLPHLLVLMGEVSLIALPANLLVLPAVAPAMALSAIAGAVSIVAPALASPFAFAAYVPLGYVIHVPEFLAHIPGASITLPAFPAWLSAFLFGCVALGILCALKIPARAAGEHAHASR